MKHALPATFVLALATLAAGQSSATKAPITLAKDTTAITTPLRPDGWPDYIKAANDRSGRDVTPANNGFVLYLQAMGTGANIYTPTHLARLLQLAGATATPPNAPVLPLFEDFLKSSGAPSGEDAIREIRELHKELWTVESHPRVADYLKTHAAALDTLAQAAMRPKWWVPSISANDSMAGIMLPALGHARDGAFALAARATLRAKSGDFDGFLKDAVAIKRLARHMSNSPTLIEHLVGIAIDSTGSVTIGTVAGPGTLTGAQCHSLATALDAMPAISYSMSKVDAFERWTQLDFVRMAAAGQFDAIAGGVMEVPITPANRPWDPAGFSAAAVDWNVVLRKVNTHVDQVVAAGNAPSVRESRTRDQAIDGIFRDWKTEAEAAGAPLKLAQRPGEARPAYSERIARSLMVVMMPELGRADELDRRATLLHQSTRVLIAAAEVKARTSKWPATLAELAPTFRAIPKDIYPIEVPGDLQYRVLPHGAIIYSVMQNGRDDGGVTGFEGKDDLAVGVKP